MTAASGWEKIRAVLADSLLTRHGVERRAEAWDKLLRQQYEEIDRAAGVVRVDTRDPRIREHGVAVAVDAWHAACHAGATNLEAMQLVFDAVLAAITEAEQ